MNRARLTSKKVDRLKNEFPSSNANQRLGAVILQKNVIFVHNSKRSLMSINFCKRAQRRSATKVTH